LAIGLGLSLYEFFVQKKDYGWTDVFVNGAIIYMFFNFYYYLKIAKTNHNINSEGVSEKGSFVIFKFDKLTAISCFLIGLAITALPIFNILKYPINELDAKEIGLLLLIGAYGILKINHTIRTLKILFGLDGKKL